MTRLKKKRKSNKKKDPFLYLTFPETQLLIKGICRRGKHGYAPTSEYVRYLLRDSYLAAYSASNLFEEYYDFSYPESQEHNLNGYSYLESLEPNFNDLIIDKINEKENVSRQFLDQTSV